MEKTNYEFLCENLRFLGFGPELQADLKQKIDQKKPAFELSYRSEFDQEIVNCTIYFAKSINSDRYFLARYELSLKGGKQLFPIFRGKGVGLKDGFNLLSGQNLVKENMEKTNYEFLCADLRFLGFGAEAQITLKEQMEQNKPAFALSFKRLFDGEIVQATIYFIKFAHTDRYVLDKYELSLNKITQQFTIFKGKGMTLKEGYNLLSGRAVFKEKKGKNGTKYNTWSQLDQTVKVGAGFRVNTYYDSYGFNLDAALDKLNFELPSPNWDRQMLIKSLEKGNRQPVFLKENGGLKKVTIEANPKEKTINIYDCSPTIRHDEEIQELGNEN
ncbi:MAG TPA: hypothetical protein VKR32_15030 [Puia sp.]|nr:hypothetical protein [Puia sp.]